jgi:hypothetical protein
MVCFMDLPRCCLIDDNVHQPARFSTTGAGLLFNAWSHQVWVLPISLTP